MDLLFRTTAQRKTKIYIAQKRFYHIRQQRTAINTPNIPQWMDTRGLHFFIGNASLVYRAREIYYQLEADRMIIQYDNVTDGWSGSATAQMVLFANGNIRFFYETLRSPAEYLSVLMEDVAKQDGILIDNYNKVIDMYNGLKAWFWLSYWILSAAWWMVQALWCRAILGLCDREPQHVNAGGRHNQSLHQFHQQRSSPWRIV